MQSGSGAGSASFTVTHRTIPEIPVVGKPLGRHVRHDSRSLQYLVAADGKVASATWKRDIPVLDQGQVGSCHDGDTEILTSAGWIPFVDLTLDHALATVDPVTRELIYERPSRVVRLPYTGDIYTVTNRRHDFRVTPDHTMLVRKWDERGRGLAPDYSFVPMRDLGRYAGLLETVVFKGTPHDGTYCIPGIPGYKRVSQREDLVVPMRSWLGFLGIYLAEGTVLNDSGHKIQVAASKDREKIFVRRILAELGLAPLELRDRFTFYSARIWRHLEVLGLKGVYASEKFVPGFVFELPAADIDTFLQAHREGDGSRHNGGWAHDTSSPRLSDDLQRLIFLAGVKVGVSVRGPRSSTMRDGRALAGRHQEHAVRHLLDDHGCIERRKDVTIEQYDGIVYCAEVPTHHTLVTRRNGKILISGNCTGNATVGALGTDPLYATLPAGTKTDESEALVIYSGAEKIDGGVGYPPEDHGSSGLSVAKEALSLGLISGYQHITSVSAAQTAIQSGPFIVGTDWYTGMDSPTAAGLVTATGTVRGGHEYECHEYDADHDLWWFYNSWGTSYGVEGRFCYSSATFASLLANQGDATVFVPLGSPKPTPTPAPPSTGVTITDAAVVAKIDELAAKQHEDPVAYTTARLRELWKLT
jgi:hypothetical protein